MKSLEHSAEDRILQRTLQELERAIQAFPSAFFTHSRAQQPLRVLIEGGFEDNFTLPHHLDRERYHIPPQTGQIVLAGYTLELVTVFTPSGSIGYITPIGRRGLTLKYGISRIERPTTLITEDGRIFHDKDLLFSRSQNNGRLKHFLTILPQEYASFEDFYAQRRRIRNSA